jgi:hypothetical protein
MGSYAAISYGVSLTDEFGGCLKQVSNNLLAFARAICGNGSLDSFEDYLDQEDLDAIEAVDYLGFSDEVKTCIASVATADDQHMVFGFHLEEKDLDKPDLVAQYRQRWQALLDQVPAPYQAELLALAQTLPPRVHLMSGRD